MILTESGVELSGDHNYYIMDGNKYVRATHAIGKIPKPWLDDWRQKVGDEEADRIRDETSADGDRIHKVTELWDRGEKREAWNLVDQYEWLLPYLIAWKVWSETRIARWIFIEQLVIHSKLRYGGRMDRLGLYIGDAAPTIVDLKSTGSLSRSIGIQLYLYRSALVDTIHRLGLSPDLIPERTVVAHLPGPRWKPVNGIITNVTEFDKVVVKEYSFRLYQNDAIECVQDFWKMVT